jgi:hypothetical protein
MRRARAQESDFETFLRDWISNTRDEMTVVRCRNGKYKVKDCHSETELATYSRITLKNTLWVEAGKTNRS